jgi:hypothetical protein
MRDHTIRGGRSGRSVPRVSKLVIGLAVVIVPLSALVSAGPVLVALAHAAVPLAPVIGLVVVMIRWGAFAFAWIQHSGPSGSWRDDASPPSRLLHVGLKREPHPIWMPVLAVNRGSAGAGHSSVLEPRHRRGPYGPARRFEFRTSFGTSRDVVARSR